MLLGLTIVPKAPLHRRQRNVGLCAAAWRMYMREEVIKRGEGAMCELWASPSETGASCASGRRRYLARQLVGQYAEECMSYPEEP